MEKQTSRIFNPQDYISEYYTTPEGHSQENMQGQPQIWTNQAFNIIPNCDTYLQIGCGPVLTFAANAVRKCSKIYLSQYNLECFKLISQELTKGEQQTSSWKPHYQLIGKLQGVDEKIIAKRLKQKVVACFKCDLTNQNILVDMIYFQKVDVILSSLCIEAVAKNIQDYKKIIKNIKNLLKKNGFIYLFGVLEQSFYMVKNQKLPCLKLTQEDVKCALEENGFQVVKFNSYRPENPPTQTSDFKGVFSVLAKNIN